MVLGVRVISRSLSAGAVVAEVAVETHSARVWFELHVYLFFGICVVSSVGKHFVGPYIDPTRLSLYVFFCAVGKVARETVFSTTKSYDNPRETPFSKKSLIQIFQNLQLHSCPTPL